MEVDDKMMTKVRAVPPRSWVTAALAGALALAALPSAANPIFGPDMFTKITASGTSDVYTANVTAPTNGFYMVWMHNGDEGSDRVTGGSVTLSGTATITAANDMSFQQVREFFWRPVFLTSGSHTLTVTLTTADPGAYLALVITPLADHFDLTVGRLILPYADSTNTTLVLKNGAHHHHRFARVHCYGTDGSLQAYTDPTTSSVDLAPAANDARTAPNFCTAGGAWTAGSIEVFWVGRGGARVFGTATTIDPTSSTKSLVEMEHAGYRHRDPYLLINQ
jgi:hypothetical protein